MEDASTNRCALRLHVQLRAAGSSAALRFDDHPSSACVRSRNRRSETRPSDAAKGNRDDRSGGPDIRGDRCASPAAVRDRPDSADSAGSAGSPADWPAAAGKRRRGRTTAATERSASGWAWASGLAWGSGNADPAGRSASATESGSAWGSASASGNADPAGRSGSASAWASGSGSASAAGNAARPAGRARRSASLAASRSGVRPAGRHARSDRQDGL